MKAQEQYALAMHSAAQTLSSAASLMEESAYRTSLYYEASKLAREALPLLPATGGKRTRSILAVSAVGCQTGGKALRMIAHVDAMAPEDRPKDWARTRALMLREAPAIGLAAPDFTARRMNSDESVTLSEYHPGQPKVLIFGSYT